MILDGRRIKNEILDSVKEEVNNLSIKPSLVVIQVGLDEASNVYIKQKEKMALDVGYKFLHVKYGEEVTTSELVKKIDELNNDDTVHGILVQMPLPSHIDEAVIQNAVRWDKDVDGLSSINAGRLFHNEDALFPCTPYGILELLDKYNIDICGKHAVVVGRSNLVGKPMAMMLLNKGATVTMCHSKTKNLKEHTKMADILIVAVGKANFITSDMVKEDSVIIDVGINRLEDGICGDVDYDMVKDKVSYITPVPGGVGQMTVAMLSVNVLKAYQLQNK